MRCGHVLGFLPPADELGALEPVDQRRWRTLVPGLKEQLYRCCKNAEQYEVCNWMVPVNDPNEFCVSCRLNEMIPDLSVSGNQYRWRKLEMAKRRVIYTLIQLSLPMAGVAEENRPALRFKFVGDVAGEPSPMTGHLNGLITINIAEADDPERERRRVSLHEPYRTLLGHLRHEVAHYYWDRLVANSQWLTGFRQLFGDESTDYASALKQYHERGPAADWQARHVSAYASAHPWEDWAETGAHYFHIMDMVETAGSLGMKLQPNHPAAKSMTADPGKIAHIDANFDAILENWFPLTHALNSLNRSMGLLDAYPFVVSTQAIEKLRFIHEVVKSARTKERLPD
jgi:hypothetical protein